jgi:hypothetical protein
MEPRPPVSLIPKQNLIKQIRPFAFARTGVFYKIAFLHLCVVGSALAFGYLYKQYLAGTPRFTLLICAATIFGVSSVFETVLVRSFKHRFYVILAETVALAAFFVHNDMRTVATMVAVILALLLWGEIGSRYEMSQSISIRFLKVARRQLNKAITALIFMAVLLYVPVLQTQDVLVSERTFSNFYGWLTGVLYNFFPELNLQSSVGEFVQGVLTLQTKEHPAFLNIPTAEQYQLIEKQAGEIVSDFQKKIGVPLAINEPLRGAAFQILTVTLKDWRTRFNPWFVTMWAIALFLAVEGVGLFFYWLVALVAYIIFELLLAFGAIRIVGESQVKELAEFS